MNQGAPRYNTSEIAKVQVYGRPGEITARLRNISATGALLELESGDFLPKRSEFIHVIVHLNGLNKTHEVDGQVVWNDGMKFGILFIKRNLLADAILKSM